MSDNFKAGKLQMIQVCFPNPVIKRIDTNVFINMPKLVVKELSCDELPSRI
jgi:hypothetical protein